MTILYLISIITACTILIGLTLVVKNYTMFLVAKIRGNLAEFEAKQIVLYYKKLLLMERIRGEIQAEEMDFQAREQNRQLYIDSFRANLE